jgi:hypothetical protein
MKAEVEEKEQEAKERWRAEQEAQELLRVNAFRQKVGMQPLESLEGAR